MKHQTTKSQTAAYTITIVLIACGILGAVLALYEIKQDATYFGPMKSTQNTGPKDLMIFVFAGQSNMTGRGKPPVLALCFTAHV